MTPTIIDIESYYDSDITLKKLSTIEYVHKTHIHGVGIYHNGQSLWLNAEQAERWIHLNKPQLIVGHNLLFDAQMLKHHYGYVAPRYCDTLSLSRAMLNLVSYKLDTVAKYLGAEGKSEGVELCKNAKLTEEQFEQLGTYCLNDVALTLHVFNWLHKYVPAKELDLIDLTIRWCLREGFYLNPEITQFVDDYKTDRQRIIQESGVPESVLSSNKQFAEWLEAMDFTVPYKISPTTGKPAPAFGKSDQAWQDADIPEHIKAGRLAAKSTIGISRAQRFANIRKLQPWIPVMLQYRGAHSSRWSGRNYNLQNLPVGPLRKALIAPPGHKLVVADSAQIELRLNLWFCGHPEEMKVLHEGKDLYRLTAADIFNIPPEQVTPKQRAVGKAATLGAGYNMGWRKFHAGCNSGALNRGVPIPMDERTAELAIEKFRAKFSGLPKTWDALDSYLNVLVAGLNEPYGVIKVTTPNYLDLPPILDDAVGTSLHYPALRFVNETGEWLYGRTAVHKMYGAKLLENIIQALARQVIAEQILLAEQAGLHTISSTHDEIICIAPDEAADEHLSKLMAIMRTAPKWANGLLLDATGHAVNNYNDAK